MYNMINYYVFNVDDCHLLQFPLTFNIDVQCLAIRQRNEDVDDDDTYRNHIDYPLNVYYSLQ